MGGDSSLTPSEPVDVLVLGAGWLSQFLLPLLSFHHLTHVGTTRDGRGDTLPFNFQYPPPSPRDDIAQFRALPHAKTILITFPLVAPGAASYLVTTYVRTHPTTSRAFDSDPASHRDPDPPHHWILLGTSSIFDIPSHALWVDRHSPYDESNARAVAEDELLAISGTVVLNLVGLWGAQRMVQHWLNRIAPTKEKLSAKRSLHMVHGLDVSRGIVGVIERFGKLEGSRWLLTDLLVYDWWALVLRYATPNTQSQTEAVAQQEHQNQFQEGIAAAGVSGSSDPDPSDQLKWVLELMREHDVSALPRSPSALGRCYDSREFWHVIDVTPMRSGL